LLYDVRSRGAESYIKLAKEIMHRKMNPATVPVPESNLEKNPEDLSISNELKRVNES
jgi:hypothetical protein